MNTVSKESQIVELYNAGFGPKIVAEKLNVTPTYVTKIATRNRITHNYNKATHPEKIQQIYDNYMLGNSLTFLAKKHGLSVSTIKSYVDSMKPVEEYTVRIQGNKVQYFKNGIKVLNPIKK